jgi:hypothetical protein
LVIFWDVLPVQLSATLFKAVAVKAALWLLETAPAVAVNVAEVVPAGIVSELLGTGRRVLLLDNNTSIPPLGAGPLNVTVHDVVAPEFKLVGLQAIWETESICPEAT